jgi:hypothetical protein
MFRQCLTILLTFSTLLYPMPTFAADVNPCDLLDAEGAAEILGSPITSPPSAGKVPSTSDAPYESSSCGFSSIGPGRAQYVRLDLQVFKSVAEAKKSVDAEFDQNDDKNIRFSRESGVGDSAFYSQNIRDNRGIYVFRKSNRIVIMQAGGSGFKMTPAYQSALRKVAIRALGKL